MKVADHVIDLGPGAGEQGGRVVFQGSYAELLRDGRSLTGKYLRGELQIAAPPGRRRGNGLALARPRRARPQPQGHRRPHPARHPDLRDRRLGLRQVHARPRRPLRGPAAPPRALGPAGGRARRHRRGGVRRRGRARRPVADRAHAALEPRHLRQGLRRHPRAVRGHPRRARAAASRPAHFSFNVPGGRCEACAGDGQVRVDMQFLADVYLVCETCGGRRYRRPCSRCATTGGPSTRSST